MDSLTILDWLLSGYQNRPDTPPRGGQMPADSDWRSIMSTTLTSHVKKNMHPDPSIPIILPGLRGEIT